MSRIQDSLNQFDRQFGQTSTGIHTPATDYTGTGGDSTGGSVMSSYLSLTGGIGVGSVVVHLITIPKDTFESQEIVTTVCNKEHYRYGYNGQMKVNEVAGVGNHNTSLFGEFDTRRAGRWNQDPKPNPSWSVYSTYFDNPIMNNDVNGDYPNGMLGGASMGIMKFMNWISTPTHNYITEKQALMAERTIGGNLRDTRGYITPAGAPA